MGNGTKLPRILVVDDHSDTVEVTAFLLTKNGYEVVAAYSVAGADRKSGQVRFVLKCIYITDNEFQGLETGNLVQEVRG